ncbi:MAG: HD domain-containing protein, partial [Spirochaetia bacterium]|nr:HD domain-containing protein [Spirochaetia bacterium]
DRFLLESAAMLHNVGMVVAHSAHHKHSAYIIKNSELLMGFTKDEIETMAMLARYHRKADPSRKHPDFALLPEQSQKKIKTLTGILRLAIALDRSGRGLVRSITLQKSPGVLVCTVGAAPDAGGAPVDLSLETWAAGAKLDLLEKVLDTRIRVEPASLRG